VEQRLLLDGIDVDGHQLVVVERHQLAADVLADETEPRLPFGDPAPVPAQVAPHRLALQRLVQHRFVFF